MSHPRRAEPQASLRAPRGRRTSVASSAAGPASTTGAGHSSWTGRWQFELLSLFAVIVIVLMGLLVVTINSTLWQNDDDQDATPQHDERPAT